MSKIKHKIIIGAHVSSAGGIFNAVSNAEKIGAEAIQIFASSARQWRVRKPSVADLKEYKQVLKKSNISAVFLHAPYLVNLASASVVVRRKSLQSLTAHFKIAQEMGARGVVVHTGSAGESESTSIGIARLVRGLKDVLKNVPGRTYLAVENSSGGGWKIGMTPEELGAIFKGVHSPRLKMCFDTAHAYESGMIRYTPEDVKKTLDVLEQEIGKNKILLVHANDSKTGYNSRHDRHENIGEGTIGLRGFCNLAKDKRLWNIPWILETPGFDKEGPDRKNIERLKSCF